MRVPQQQPGNAEIEASNADSVAAGRRDSFTEVSACKSQASCEAVLHEGRMCLRFTMLIFSKIARVCCQFRLSHLLMSLVCFWNITSFNPASLLQEFEWHMAKK